MRATPIRKYFYQFENVLKIICTISSQTAVHRKKFDYCIDQIQLFLTSIVPTLPNNQCTKEEIDINVRIMSTFSTLRGIMLQYILQTWMEPTTMNPSDLILLQLQTQFQELQKLFSHYNEQLSHIFDIDEKKWQELHLLDLTAIYTSFKNFLEQENKDSETELLVRSRIKEIEEYMSKYKKDFKTTELSSPLPEQYRRWKVNYNDFDILSEIGRGFSADVYKAVDRRTGELVAIKQFKEKNLSSNHLQHYQREIAVLSLLSEKNEPFFIELVGATDTFPICIITKYMPNGGLNTKVFKKHPTPTFKTISAYCIARGMAFLHSLNIIHRDLKSLNVLLDKDDNIKICDFGFSRTASDSGFKTFPIGTLRWMAPEIMSGVGNYTFKVDVYAYGMVLSELVNQTRPFNKMKNDEIKKLVLEKGIRPELPFDLNPELHELIVRCWDKNPELRPTFDEIVNLFESFQVIFDGTDIGEFKRYMDNLNKTANFDKNKMKLNRLKTGSMSLRDIIDDFANNGLPSDQVAINSYWSIVTSIADRHSDRAKLANLISFFFGTSKLSEAVKILRSFPRNSVPFRVIEKLVGFYPAKKRKEIMKTQTKTELENETKLEQENKIKTEQENETKNEQKNETKTEQENETKTEQENETKTEQENETKLEQENKIKTEQENETKLEQENKTKNEQKNETKLDQKIAIDNDAIDEETIEMEIDSSIAVICCRNYCAPLILSNATNERDILLALEVIAAEDVSLDMRELVIQSILQKLSESGGSESDSVKISAMRCALTLKIQDLVPIENLIVSENSLVRHHAYACAIGSGIGGKKIDLNVIEQVLSRSLFLNDGGHEHEAQATIIALCSSEENAEAILNELIENGEIWSNWKHDEDEEENLWIIATIIKILMNSAKHRKLFPVIQQIISKPVFEKLDSFGDQINSLKKHIQLSVQ